MAKRETNCSMRYPFKIKTHGLCVCDSSSTAIHSIIINIILISINTDCGVSEGQLKIAHSNWLFIQTMHQNSLLSWKIIIIIKVFVKHKILFIENILSAYTHRGTHTQEHSNYTKLNLHSLKRAANRLEMDEDSSMVHAHRTEKTWQVYSFGKINVFRLSREGFCRRGRGWSFYIYRSKKTAESVAQSKTILNRV